MKIINDRTISYLVGQDQIFGTIVELYDLPPAWSRPQGFETLCRIIIEQQVSLDSANAAYRKLSSYIMSFTPQSIIDLNAEQMRSATISRQKSSYLKALSHEILLGSLDILSLSKVSERECFERLVKIKGIGPWTANVYMMFALQSPDIFPPGDIALINTIKEMWSIKTASDALNKSKEWAPYRSTAAYLLWHYYLKKRGRENPI